MILNFFRRNLAAFVLVPILSGCGGGANGPATIPVTGVVTYQGKPIPKLSVAFIPDKGMLATGTTDDQGRFSLMTSKPGDGAMAGSYKVAINAVSDAPPPMPGFPGAEEAAAPSPIPAKYADPATSGLIGTVEASKKNEFTFDLTD